MYWRKFLNSADQSSILLSAPLWPMMEGIVRGSNQGPARGLVVSGRGNLLASEGRAGVIREDGLCHSHHYRFFADVSRRTSTLYIVPAGHRRLGALAVY